MTFSEEKKTYVTPQGYENLCLGGRTALVHRWVAEQNIPNPDNKPCVNHIDGNKLNNSIENLEWATYSENAVHAFKTGLKHNHHPKPRKRVAVLATRGTSRHKFKSINEASANTGVIRTAISNCLIGRAKTAGGFKWQYL